MTNVQKPERPVGMLTPGLGWRPMRTGSTITSWQAWWIATAPGFDPRTRRLWPSSEAAAPLTPTLDDWFDIQSACLSYQDEQTKWKAGAAERPPVYDGTLRSLFRIYQTDADSPAHQWRYRTRVVKTGYLAILEHELGAIMLKDLTFRHFKRWADEFRAPKYPGGPERNSRAGSLLALIKAAIAFGAALELKGCARVHAIIGSRKAGGTGALRIEGARRRTEIMTAAQVVAFRAEAHRQGWHSLALAQAVQFETSLRQGDIIGQWTPQSEPGLSDITHAGWKWGYGLHWRDVDESLVLTKQISKSIHGRRNVGRADVGKVERFDLKSYPMIVEELKWCANFGGSQSMPIGESGHRSDSGDGFSSGSTDTTVTILSTISYPTYVASQAGPMIVCERTGLPWTYALFRLRWREIARAAGIPDSVQNRDARAGGITEGEQAGATREQLRVHAAHSSAAMTDSYDRGGVATRNMVAQLRAKRRTE